MCLDTTGYLWYAITGTAQGNIYKWDLDSDKPLDISHSDHRHSISAIKYINNNNNNDNNNNNNSGYVIASTNTGSLT
ncbi:hypothetical protein, partial [Salmonella sp. s54836]|uniref:hypothetical protein n=1 Tax=Salmonella sp. s54836 TaxID=3159673 RepID=UPI003980C6FF